MTTPRSRVTAAVAIGAVVMSLVFTGCSNAQPETEPPMTTSTSSDSDQAKTAWDDANALAEAAQRAVGGSWTATDSAAERCQNGAVRWGLLRVGPPISTDQRSAVLDSVAELWRAAGYEPVRKSLGGDAPGTELRYPEVDTLPNGFFIEFGTTDNASTLQMQTPCTPGDADQLNREKYAEKHTNTPPDIPGASSPSTEATP